MTFPVPGVAGVFLNLSQRVKGAITSGGAAHYLIGRSPERLRNHLGFHGAIAEFMDALLERAVLPYQTTPSLPSLTVLPSVDFPGHDSPPPGESPSPELYAPVSLDPVISTARKRARLGHEKRLAPLEFWKAMFRGSDALARFAGPVELLTPNAGSGSGSYSDMSLYVYASDLHPVAGSVPSSYDPETESCYGFSDVVDTGWEDSTDYPGVWRPDSPTDNYQHTTQAENGRITLGVRSMLEYEDHSSSSLPMLAGLAGFGGQFTHRQYWGDQRCGIWPWWQDEEYGTNWVIHGGFQFAGKMATYRHYPWDRPHPLTPFPSPASWATNTPYEFDYAGGIVHPELELAVAKAYNALRSVGYYDESTWEWVESDPDDFPPWISPFDPERNHRSISTTARANLDILRIQQVLLGSMWANWAHFVHVTYAIRHKLAENRRRYEIQPDGTVSEIASSTTTGSPTIDNQLVWDHGVSGDSWEPTYHGCHAYSDFEIDLSQVEGTDPDSGDTLYLLDRFAGQDYAAMDAQVRDAQSQMAAATAQAEADKAGAQADFDSALAGWVSALSQVEEGDISSGASQFYPFDNQHGVTFLQSVKIQASCLGREMPDLFSDGVWLYCSDGQTSGAIGTRYWLPDRGGLFTMTLRNALLNYSGGSSYSGSLSEMLLTGTQPKIRVRVGSNAYYDAPSGLMDALVAWHQACYDIERDAETFAEEHPGVVELATKGVCVDVSAVLRGILEDNHYPPWAVLVSGSSHLECPDDPVVNGIVQALQDNPGASESDLSTVGEAYMPSIYIGAYAWCKRPAIDSGDPSGAVSTVMQYGGTVFRDASPWPAECLVGSNGYVSGETVAVGMTVHDHDVRGYLNPQSGETEYRQMRQEEDSTTLPDEEFRRVAMMDSYQTVQKETPARLAGELISTPFAPFDTSTGLHEIVRQSFQMLTPIVTSTPAIPPIVGRTDSHAVACYHPDKQPSWCSAIGPRGRRPYLITISYPGAGGGSDGSCVCHLDEGESTITARVAVAVEYTTQGGDCHSVSEELVVDIKPEMAVRAVWAWKSMPVSQ